MNHITRSKRKYMLSAATIGTKGFFPLIKNQHTARYIKYLITRNEKVVSSILTSSSNFSPLISQEFSGFSLLALLHCCRGAHTKSRSRSVFLTGFTHALFGWYQQLPQAKFTILPIPRKRSSYRTDFSLRLYTSYIFCCCNSSLRFSSLHYFLLRPVSYYYFFSTGPQPLAPDDNVYFFLQALK